MKFQVKSGDKKSGAVKRFGFKGRIYFAGDIIEVSSKDDIATLRNSDHIVKELVLPTLKKPEKKGKKE